MSVSRAFGGVDEHAQPWPEYDVPRPSFPVLPFKDRHNWAPHRSIGQGITCLSINPTPFYQILLRRAIDC